MDERTEIGSKKIVIKPRRKLNYNNNIITSKEVIKEPKICSVVESQKIRRRSLNINS